MPTTNDNSIVTKGILRYFYGKLHNNVNTLLSLKVDKEDGKGLSTNDFTNAYKNKLDGLSNHSLPIASGSKLGGIKTGYTSTGKTYGVQVDADGDAYVSVPWTDTNTTYNVVSKTANGLAPMLPTENADKKFLNGQGQWIVPETGSDINPDDYVKKSGDTMTGDLNMEAGINFGSQKGMSKDQSNRLIIGDTEHHTIIQSSSKVGVYNGKSGEESIVDTGDIVDNLSSTETKKPLSAAQGKVLSDKLNNVIKLGTVIGIGQARCLYQDGNTLKSTRSFPGESLNKTDYLCFLTLQAISGTPYNQTSAISYSFSGQTMTIEVRGSGFVSGHIVIVNYLLIKVGD